MAKKKVIATTEESTADVTTELKEEEEEVKVPTPPKTNTAAKAFKMAAAAVDKKFPNAFHAWLYEDEKLVQRRFSSGSIGLDAAMGGEGLPFGRIIEVWGPTGGGKTSWSLEAAWNLQQQTGLGVVFIDLERKFDASLLKRWKGGFVPELTRIEMPESGEDTFATILTYLESEGTGIVIVDSVSAIRSAMVLDSDNQATHFGSSANLIGQWLPKISSVSARTGVPILFINQVRAKLDAPRHARGRAKLRKYGGMAYDHWVCVSLFLAKNGMPLNDGVKDYAQWCKMVVYKNHSGPILFKELNLLLNYGYGFDEVAELVDRAIGLGVVKKTGSWMVVRDQKIQGRDKLITEAKASTELYKFLWDEVKAMQLLASENSKPSITNPGEWTGDGDDDGVEISLNSNEDVDWGQD